MKIPWPDRIVAHFHRHGWKGATRSHALLVGNRRILVMARNGVLMSVDPREYVDRFVVREGYYESEVLEALLAYMPPGGVLWDVGGNIGLHAVTVARSRPESTVVVFEPNPEMTAVVRKNAALNGASVTMIEAALDDRAGEALLYVQEGNAGRSSLHDWRGDKTLHSVPVCTMTADDAVERRLAPPPDVVKIDVEGGEDRVLRGMSGLLGDRKLRAVVFEDGPDAGTPAKAILRGAGFEVDVLERRERTHHPLSNFLARRCGS